MFQAFNLVSELTIVENVEVPLFYQGVSRAERRAQAIERLSLVGLEDRLGHRPSELSGGQQQRVAIARSLVTDPAIVMADEPTGNLDPSNKRVILEALLGAARDRDAALLAVTHDHDLLDAFDRVIDLGTEEPS